MGLVGVGVSWLVIVAVRRLLPKRLSSIPIAAALGALVSVPAAASAFTGLFAVGGVADIPVGAVLIAMVGWHSLIGIGEAIITGLVVSAVVGTRPDLVRRATDPRDHPAGGPADGSACMSTPKPRTGRWFFVAFLAAALLIAGVVSFYASGHPDGLEYVAKTTGFVDSAGTPPPAAHWLTTGWRVENARLSVGLAGIIGVLVTLLLAGSLAWLLRRRTGHTPEV